MDSINRKGKRMVEVTIPEAYNGSCSICKVDMWQVPSYEISLTYNEPLVMTYGCDIEGHRCYVCDSCVSSIRDGSARICKYNKLVEVVKSFTGKE